MGSLTAAVPAAVTTPATAVSCAAEVNVYLSPRGSDTNSGLSEQAPLLTLPAAQRVVRLLRAEDAARTVIVQMLGGTYPLSEAVVFTAADSGSEGFPVTYRARDTTPVIFTGGERIEGWKPHKGNIWVTTLPEVASGDWNFKQLYVNGELRSRARTPNTGTFKVAALPGVDMSTKYNTPSINFEYAAGDLDPKWRNITQAEVVAYHYWTDIHLPVASIDGKSRIVTFQYPSGKLFRDGFKQELARYVVENVYEAMDEPGEWVLNRATGELFYLARPDEDLTVQEIIAPRTEELIRLEGDPQAGVFVEHVRFEGLQFMYSNFVLTAPDCNDGQGSASVRACVNLTGARYCSFDDCTFRNLGGFGVELFSGCMFNNFRHNTMEQISAGAFRLRGVPAGSHPNLRTASNNLSDNTIAHYGLTYPSAVGILVMHSDANTITHNHIHHGDYTGISVGWSWGYLRSASRNNLIEANHIHDIGHNNLLSDMGGIYTLGLSPGTVIRGNLIYNVNANQYGGWGIYMDEGSTSILVENNVVYNTKFGMFNIHYARDIHVRNNIFALGRLEQISRERIEPHVSVYFEGNIVYWRDGIFMAQDWSNKPYKMYGSFFQREIPADETTHLDWNLYYNPTKTRDQVDFNGHTWAAWQALGKDVHSVYADPMFVDPERNDFRLRVGSPALGLGFKDIDLSEIGPRAK